jgi:hypothetical protein
MEDRTAGPLDAEVELGPHRGRPMQPNVPDASHAFAKTAHGVVAVVNNNQLPARVGLAQKATQSLLEKPPAVSCSNNT